MKRLKEPIHVNEFGWNKRERSPHSCAHQHTVCPERSGSWPGGRRTLYRTGRQDCVEMSMGISGVWDRSSSRCSSWLALSCSSGPLWEWSLVFPSSPSDTDRFSELKVEYDLKLLMQRWGLETDLKTTYSVANGTETHRFKDHMIHSRLLGNRDRND